MRSKLKEKCLKYFLFKFYAVLKFKNLRKMKQVELDYHYTGMIVVFMRCRSVVSARKEPRLKNREDYKLLLEYV